MHGQGHGHGPELLVVLDPLVYDLHHFNGRLVATHGQQVIVRREVDAGRRLEVVTWLGEGVVTWLVATVEAGGGVRVAGWLSLG